MTPIHFRGAGPAVTAVVSGEPAIGSMAISGPLPHIKSGRLRALAVFERKTRPFPSRRAYFCRSGLSRPARLHLGGKFFSLPGLLPLSSTSSTSRSTGAAKRRFARAAGSERLRSRRRIAGPNRRIREGRDREVGKGRARDGREARLIHTPLRLSPGAGRRPGWPSAASQGLRLSRGRSQAGTSGSRS